MKIVNMTPHDVVVRLDDGSETQYKASGKVARARTKKQTKIGDLDDKTPIYTLQEFEGVDMPPFPNGTTAIIVSMIVGDQLKIAGLTHVNASAPNGTSIEVYAPDSGPEAAIRTNGDLIATKRLVY